VPRARSPGFYLSQSLVVPSVVICFCSLPLPARCDLTDWHHSIFHYLNRCISLHLNCRIASNRRISLQGSICLLSFRGMQFIAFPSSRGLYVVFLIGDLNHPSSRGLTVSLLYCSMSIPSAFYIVRCHHRFHFIDSIPFSAQKGWCFHIIIELLAFACSGCGCSLLFF